MSEPEWSDFKILSALGRGGSVASAARILGVDHSTVSRRLAALEQSVGVSLLVRGGREFSWTPAGRIMLTAAESIEGLVAAATCAVRSHKQEVGGTIRVSLPPGLSSLVSRLLLAARDRQPELAIELSAENRTVDLTKGEADLALRMFRPTEPDLVCKQVMELGWIACASKSYLAAHGHPTSVADLSKHQVVAYVEAMNRVAGPRWLEENRGAARTPVKADNTEVAGHAVASGVGIGVLPVFVAEGHLEIMRVFPEPIAFATGFIVYHEALRDTARIRAAVELLADVFAENAARFSGRSA